MRIETRYIETVSGAIVDRILLICETPMECHLLDLVGDVDQQVKGELRLSDGYGDFYLMLPAKVR